MRCALYTMKHGLFFLRSLCHVAVQETTKNQMRVLTALRILLILINIPKVCFPKNCSWSTNLYITFFSATSFRFKDRYVYSALSQQDASQTTSFTSAWLLSMATYQTSLYDYFSCCSEIIELTMNFSGQSIYKKYISHQRNITLKSYDLKTFFFLIHLRFIDASKMTTQKNIGCLKFLRNIYFWVGLITKSVHTI